MDKIFLKTELITGNTLTQDGVLAYIALRTLIDESIPLYNRTSSIDCISVNRLAYLLIGEMDYEKALTDALARGIAELASGEWISIRKDLSTNKSYEFVLDIKKLWLDTEKDKFTVVYTDDIHKIMTCNEKMDKMDKKLRILKYFVTLVSTFDWSLDGKIGHMSQEYIAGLADIAVRTLQRYNDILVEKQIIYIYKSNDKIPVNDKLNQIKNCYSRYDDRNVCERYATGYEEMYGVQHKIVRTKKNKEQADNNRRLAQIYNRIREGYGDSYDEATIKKVHKYIVNKNKSLQEQIDEKNHQKYLTDSDKSWVEKLESQIRDEDIFEQFEFLNDVSQNGNAENGESNNFTDQWGEPDPMEQDFTVEEMLDMDDLSDMPFLAQRTGEVLPDPTPKVTDCDLQSEGVSESCGITNSDRQKSENPKMDSEEIGYGKFTNSDTIQLDANEQFSQNSSTTDDLELIDIDSLFDEEADDKPVLSENEAWELFS